MSEQTTYSREEYLAVLNRAFKAEAQLRIRYGLRKEINKELGLTDEMGDEALQRGLAAMKSLKRKLNALKRDAKKYKAELDKYKKGASK